MTPRHDDNADDLYVAVAGMGLVGVIATVTIVCMLHLVDALGPRIGDMISFDPTSKIGLETDTRIAVTPAGNRPGVSCVLDVRVMLASGGSVVIEAAQPKPDRGFRVHWAGARTSNGPTDCGPSAELVLSHADMVTLRLAVAR